MRLRRLPILFRHGPSGATLRSASKTGGFTITPESWPPMVTGQQHVLGQIFQYASSVSRLDWAAKCILVCKKIDRVKHNKGLIVILTFQSKLKQAMQMHQSLQL